VFVVGFKLALPAAGKAEKSRYRKNVLRLKKKKKEAIKNH
jgi:hypothetical protein